MGDNKRTNTINKDVVVRRSLSDYERHETGGVIFTMVHAFFNSLFIDYPYQRQLNRFRLFCVDTTASVGHLSRLGLVVGIMLFGCALYALTTEIDFVIAAVAAASLLAVAVCLVVLCSLLHNMACSVHACMHMRAFIVFNKTVALRNALCQAKVHLGLLIRPEYTTKYPAGLEYSVARKLEEVIDELLTSYRVIEIKSDSKRLVDLDERAVECERWLCAVNEKVLNLMLPRSLLNATERPKTFVPVYSIISSPFRCVGFVLGRGVSILNHLLCRLPGKIAGFLLSLTHKCYRFVIMPQTNSLLFKSDAAASICDRYNADPLSTIHTLLACADKRYVLYANTTVQMAPAILDEIKQNYNNEPAITEFVDTIKVSYWLKQEVDNTIFNELHPFFNEIKHSYTQADVELLASHLSAISSHYSAAAKQPKKVVRLVDPSKKNTTVVIFAESSNSSASKPSSDVSVSAASSAKKESLVGLRKIKKHKKTT